MRWQKAVLSGGAALGAAAALNAMTTHDVPLENPIGGEEGWFHWRGHRVAWTRRGRGPALLLVHGIHAAAWSYEWRNAVDRLAADHTVWTLDQLGFGRSERPAIRYNAALYVALLADFVEQQIGEPTVLVGSSLSAAHTVAAAARDGERAHGRYPAMVVVNPCGVTHLAFSPKAVNDGTRALIESPLVGTALFNALVTKPSMRFFLQQAYANDAWVTEELLDAYWRTAHQPNARFAPAAFVGMQFNLNVRDALRRLDVPLLITWGDQAREVPVAELHAWQALRPDAEVAHFAPSGSLPHDERAPEWCATVLDFLARVRRGAEGPVARSA